MEGTLPVSSPAGHRHGTELWMKQGWEWAAKDEPGPAEGFSLWVLAHGKSRVPSVKPSGWRGRDLETEKAQTSNWCEPGKGRPEERAGCQNCSPCLKRGIVRSPGL